MQHDNAPIVQEKKSFAEGKKMAKKDVSGMIQQLSAFEERLGVRFEALSAFEVKDEYSDDATITIRGELHTISGSTLKDDIELQVSIYDMEGRVIETGRDYVESESFFGFHTFEIPCEVTPNAAKKLRLIPKVNS